MQIFVNKLKFKYRETMNRKGDNIYCNRLCEFSHFK